MSAAEEPDECVCDGTVPVCPGCGRAWEWEVTYSDGQRCYFSDWTMRRYEARYGKMEGQLRRVA